MNCSAAKTGAVFNHNLHALVDDASGVTLRDKMQPLTLGIQPWSKALLAGGAVSRDPEPAGFVGFHLYGSVPEPFTLYREIRFYAHDRYRRG